LEHGQIHGTGNGHLHEEERDTHSFFAEGAKHIHLGAVANMFFCINLYILSKFNHKSPGHRSAVSRLRPQVAHCLRNQPPTSNIKKLHFKLRVTQVVYLQSVSIKAPYDPQPSMNCGDTAPTVVKLFLKHLAFVSFYVVLKLLCRAHNEPPAVV
jgi:hypothetical protein